MNFWSRLFGKKRESSDDSEQHHEENQRTQKEIEAEFDHVMKALEPFKRTAYIPVVEETKKTFSAQSKMGGFPFLRHENDWPVCPNCNRHMQLFVQLNLEEIPERKDKGLVQLFYCTTSEPHCESELDAFFPFSKGGECRLIEASGVSAEIVPTTEKTYGERAFTGWEAKADYPHFEEFDSLGIDLDISEEVLELMDERDMGETIQKDKLFGWPYWVQSEEYPDDRKTGTRMELLFQVDSEDNIPYMFGDSGIGHLTQSPDNKGELGFGWACY